MVPAASPGPALPREGGRGRTRAPAEGPAESRAEGRTENRETGYDRPGEVAGLLAECLVRRLPLSHCAVYLYDRTRTNLVRVAARGTEPEPGPEDVIPLDAPSFPWSDRACFCVPLWDGRVTLGAVYGRAVAGAEVTAAVVERGRMVVRAWAVTLSYVLEDGGYAVEAADNPPVTTVPRVTPEGLNSHLIRYLRSALLRTCPEGPVSVAVVRLRSPSGRAVLPGRGVPLRAGDAAPWRPVGRVFGLAGGGRAALVWLHTDPGEVSSLLREAASGDGLGRLTGGEGAGSGVEPGTRLDAVGLAVYPRDAGHAESLVATADDFHNLQLYLECVRSSRSREFHSGGRRVEVSDKTGDRTVQVMDRLALDREIDRQKRVLLQAIEAGRSFQDREVREISEVLDRLIVVRQRYMGHRGAVP